MATRKATFSSSAGGSTYGPIHEAVTQARAHGEKIGAIHFRHLHPLPNGLEKVWSKFKRIVVVEMNDLGRLRLRPVREHPAFALLRTEDRKRDQDRRINL